MKKEFTIKGPVGELHGVIHKCPDEFESGNVMIMCHGFRGSMEGGGRAAQLAEEISERHATVVRFNFTRCAKLSVLVDELKCVIDYVRETLDPEYLILLGRSFGGATCLVTACTDEAYRPDGLCLWSTPHSLPDTFTRIFESVHPNAFYDAFLDNKDIVMDDEMGRDVVTADFVQELFQYDLGKLIRNWQEGALLVIHAENDEYVPLEDAKKNFALAGGEDKKMYVMPGDDHHLNLCFSVAGELVKRWIGKERYSWGASGWFSPAGNEGEAGKNLQKVDSLFNQIEEVCWNFCRQMPDKGGTAEYLENVKKVAELYGQAKEAKAFAVPENTKPVEECLENILQQLAQLPIL
ncbi:MAG: hypothetical protein IJV46_08220 [Acidaminococcaceae bacterium]|nr:hypothetical protein [Acidaminococcaceae bacterium]